MIAESSTEMRIWGLRNEQESLKQKGRKRSQRNYAVLLGRRNRKAKSYGLRVQVRIIKEPSRAETGVWECGGQEGGRGGEVK